MTTARIWVWARRLQPQASLRTRGSHHSSATARRFAPSLRPRCVIFQASEKPDPAFNVGCCFQQGDVARHSAGKPQFNFYLRASDLDAEFSSPTCSVFSADDILARHRQNTLSPNCYCRWHSCSPVQVNTRWRRRFPAPYRNCEVHRRITAALPTDHVTQSRLQAAGG
jgi:hypothetical protein